MCSSDLYVSGELDGGAPYSCWIDGAGRVTDIEAGDFGATYEAPAESYTGYETVQKQVADDPLGEDDGYEMAQALDLEN